PNLSRGVARVLSSFSFQFASGFDKERAKLGDQCAGDVAALRRQRTCVVYWGSLLLDAALALRSEGSPPKVNRGAADCVGGDVELAGKPALGVGVGGERAPA